MFKRKSVIYTWALFYAFLLLLILLTGVFLSKNNQKQLINEYKSITQTLQQQANESIKDYFLDLKRCSYEISTDYMVNDFVQTPDPTGSKYYNLSPIQQRLSVYALRSGDTVDRYLYMKNIDRSLSSEAIYRRYEFYDQLNIREVFSEEEFSRLLNQRHNNEMLVYDINGTPGAMMLTSIPQIGGVPKGTLVQVLDTATIAEMIQSNAAVENSTAVLLSEDGMPLCSVGNPAVVQALRSTDYLDSHNSEISINGEKYWFQSTVIPDFNQHLLTVVPMTSIRAKSDWVIHSALPILIVMFLFAGCASLYFLYIQYKPLAHLYRQMVGTPVRKQNGNEFDQLLSAFSDVRSSRDQIQSLWDQQSDDLVHEFIESCLDEDIIYNEQHVRQVIEHLGMNFKGDWFVVALIDSMQSLLNDAEIHSILSDLIEQNFQNTDSKYQIYLPSHNSQQIVLINAANSSVLDAVSARLESELSHCDTELLYSFSKPQQDFKNIHIAYLDVCEKISRRKELQRGKDIESFEPVQPTIHLSDEQEALLLQYIAAGNTAEAQNVLSVILHDNFEGSQLPVHICRCLANDLMCGILRKAGTSSDVWNQQQYLLRNDLHLLRHACERSEFAQIVQQAVERTAQAFAWTHTSVSNGKEQTLDRIMLCINDHYRETDFNVSKAAEYLGLSVPYLSNLFKQQTGIGLLSYISGLRIQYAKHCILDLHMSVTQAAHESGFENINTFIRTFKKHEGTTPGNLGE